jgi:hypothetical protein
MCCIVCWLEVVLLHLISLLVFLMVLKLLHFFLDNV